MVSVRGGSVTCYPMQVRGASVRTSLMYSGPSAGSFSRSSLLVAPPCFLPCYQSSRSSATLVIMMCRRSLRHSLHSLPAITSPWSADGWTVGRTRSHPQKASNCSLTIEGERRVYDRIIHLLHEPRTPQANEQNDRATQEVARKGNMDFPNVTCFFDARRNVR